MTRKFLLVALVGVFIVSIPVISFSAETASRDPECTSDAGFFTRMKCLFNLGINTAGDLLNKEKEAAPSAVSTAFPVDRLIASPAGIGSLNFYQSADPTPLILRGKDGVSVLMDEGGFGGIKNFTLPTARGSYEPVQFKGYIIEYKTKPVIEYQLEQQILGPSLSVKGSAAASAATALNAKVAAYGKAIEVEQNQAADDLALRLKVSRSEFERKTLGTFKNSFNGIALDIAESEIEKIKQSPQVKRVYPNYEVKIALSDSVPLIGADKVWKLDKDGNECAKSGKECLTGKGVKIGIIDTGVDYTHPDLGGCTRGQFQNKQCAKVAGGYDFVNDDSDPMDDQGHGTHVAATAAGNGVLKGVAPEALVYAIKVLNSMGGGWAGQIIAGIEWSTDPNGDGDFFDRLDVINLSLGGPGNPDDPMSQAIDRAVEVGVVAVIAAGNSGPDFETIGSPGTARKAITVAASDKTNKMAGFSSRGPVVWRDSSGRKLFLFKPDITAPGVSICAAQSSEDTIWQAIKYFRNTDVHCLDTKHISINGTSMATPHIAGVAAILKQLHPDWNSSETKSLLKSSVKDIGGGVFEEGAGRVDVLKAVQLKTPPPIVELQPLPAKTAGVPRISWQVKTITGFQALELSYAPLNGEWVKIFSVSKTSPPYADFYDWDTTEVDYGEYLLRLSVEDANGLKNSDYGYLKVEPPKFLSPLSSDILRAGDLIKVNLERPAGFTGFKLEYYTSSEVGSGPHLIADNPNNIVWDTSGLETGVYTLKATFSYGTVTKEKSISIKVHLDKTLKAGWPVRVKNNPFPCGFGSCVYYQYLEPIVVDLDNDGKEEVVVLNLGKPSELMVYRGDGSLWWKKQMANSLSLPLIVDLNNDGKKEIILLNTMGSSNFMIPSLLYAFTFDGRPVQDWVVSIPHVDGANMIAADLNLDGSPEIIVKPTNRQIDESSTMSVVSARGDLLYSWSLPYTSWSVSKESFPAVGNFDDDGDLEIVVADPSRRTGDTNKGEIHVFNIDGSEVAGWPIKTTGVTLSSPAVGDVDGDGRDDIVASLNYFYLELRELNLGGIYIFDRSGKILPGWPQCLGCIFWASPSLADLNGDGYLEIAVSRLDKNPISIGTETFLFNHDGTFVSGWPQNVSWNDFYSTVIGDVEGDRSPDILTTAGSFWFRGGGVYAWKSNGNPITGFPKATEVDAQAVAAIGDIDGDGKVDIVASSNLDFDFENSVSKSRGSLYAWETGAQVQEDTVHWPTFHRDEQRTGLYKPPILQSPKITLISPNGGERWMLNFWNTVIRWNPDPPDYPEVKAYLEKKYEDKYATIGEMLPVAKGSIQWSGDVGRYGNYPEPGDGYYVRVVNTETGAEDRSDAPFAILPADFMKADLKVSGVDGPIQLKEGTEKIEIAWTSANADSCTFYGNELGSPITDLPPAGNKTVTLNENTFGTKWVYLLCSSPLGDRGDGAELRFLNSLDVPGNFSAVLEFSTSTDISTAQVALRWADTSAEEAGFEIWRSGNDESNYTLLATAPANAVSYTDNALRQTGLPVPEAEEKEPQGFLKKSLNFITGLFSKSPEQTAEVVSALPAGVELDLPSYYPEEFLKPQKLFSGRSIRVPKDKLAEIEVVSTSETEGVVLKPKRVRGNYVSFEVSGEITGETDLKIKMKNEAGKIEEKSFKVFGAPPEASGPALEKRSIPGEPEEPPPIRPGEIKITRKNLNCGFCYWEMVMAGEPGESNNLLIQGGDRILRTVNGWLSWTNEHIDEITVKDSDFAPRWSADGKLAVGEDGDFVLPGIVVVPKGGDGTILGGGVHFGNVRGGPLREKIIKDASGIKLLDQDWLIFDFPKVALHGDNVYIAANSVKFPGGDYDFWQGVFISNDGGKTFREYKGAEALGGGAIVNMASDLNGEIYALLPGEIKLLRSLGGGDFESHNVAIQWPRLGESMLWGVPRLSTGSNRGWIGGTFGNVVIAIDKTISPRKGRIYVAYTKPEQVFYDPNFEYRRYGYNFDIFVTYSDNQGKTWSNPTRINDDAVKNPAMPGPAGYFYKVRSFRWEEQCRIGITKKFGLFCGDYKVYSDFSKSEGVEIPRPADLGEIPGDQLYPSISLDGGGNVHFAWLDRRGIMDIPYYNVYYAYSKDGGKTFSKNIKVNDEPVPNFYGGRNPGDYLDMVVGYTDKAHVAYPCNAEKRTEEYQFENASDLCVATINNSRALERER